MRILVTGASGYIGSQLIPRLVQDGHQVFGMVRDPARLGGQRWDNVEIRRGDLLDPASLDKVFRGIEIAYYLVHSMADGVSGYINRDFSAARNFSVAVRAASLRRIIYLGALGDCERNIAPHLEARQTVGDLLRQSGVPVIELRSAIIIGSGSMSFEMIRYLTERLPILPTPPWINTLCQPIAISDILDYLVKSLALTSSSDSIYEIGGPDTLTYADIMRGYAQARQLKRPLVTLPVLTTSMLALGANLVTPLPAPYLHILIEGLRSEVVVNDKTAEQVYNPRLTPYAHGVHLALQRAGTGEVEAFWKGAPPGLEPGRTHKDVEGMFVEQRRTVIAASPDAVYRVVEKIGGKRGWYYANWLWSLRGWLDELVGGPGMRRGRRDPDQLATGDVLDGWRVEIIQAGRLIRLSFEMKAPGPAWLQFEVQARQDGGTLLILTAFFEPHGVAGLLYWYSLYPFHLLIFKYMPCAIARLAQIKSTNP